MSDLDSVTARTFRAIALAELVDLEAHWENLRIPPAGTRAGAASLKELQGKQRAYEVFHAKLVAFNKRHAPAHVPELLLNTPPRLGDWCRKMRDLFILIEQEPRARVPLHLLEKAYLWADRVAERQGKTSGVRPPPPADIRAVIGQLDDLARWCDGLTHLAFVA